MLPALPEMLPESLPESLMCAGEHLCEPRNTVTLSGSTSGDELADIAGIVAGDIAGVRGAVGSGRLKSRLRAPAGATKSTCVDWSEAKEWRQ